MRHHSVVSIYFPLISVFVYAKVERRCLGGEEIDVEAELARLKDQQESKRLVRSNILNY